MFEALTVTINTFDRHFFLSCSNLKINLHNILILLCMVLIPHQDLESLDLPCLTEGIMSIWNSLVPILSLERRGIAGLSSFSLAVLGLGCDVGSSLHL